MRALVLALLCLPAAAAAEPIRLLGEASSGQRFVIDAVIEAGDGPLSRTVDEGWFAVLSGPDWESGELDGQCVEDRCAFSVEQPNATLVLAGDLLKASEARFELQGEGAGTGAVTLAPLGADVPGLGRLAALDAVSAADLTELLDWAGFSTGFFNPSDDAPPGDSEREGLAEWQAANGRPASGLLFEEDLAALRAAAAQQKGAYGWTEVENRQGGWKAAYPAALLRALSVSASPAERRFASDDGKVTLTIGGDPPITEEAWDAFVDERTEDRPGLDHSYTRINDDFEIVVREAGEVTAAAFRHGKTAQRRMVLTYPEAEAERWDPIAERMLFVFRRGSAGD